MLKTLTCASFGILLAGVIILFGFNSYPLCGTDSFGFTPGAINHHAGRGLINEISFAMNPAFQSDPVGEDRLVWFPPLFPLVLSFLMWEATPQSVFFVIALINSFSLLGLLMILLKLLKPSSGKIGWTETLIICLSLLGLATNFIGTSVGRPESLATLIFVLAMISWIFWPRNTVWIILGLLLGVMGASHPVAALLLACVITVAYSIVFDTKTALKHLVAIAAISIGICLTLIELGPFNLSETFYGIYQRSKIDLMPGKPTWEDFWVFYFTSPGQTFYGLLIFAPTILAVFTSIKLKHKIHSPLIFFPSVLISLSAVGFFAFRSFTFYFNLLLFAPLFFAALAYYAARAARHVPLKIFLIGVLALTSVGFTRSVLLFPTYLHQGISLEEARQNFKEIKPRISTDSSKFILMGTSLWILFDEYKNVHLPKDTRLKSFNDPESANYVLIFQQNLNGLNQAPERIDRYVLRHNFFAPGGPPKLWGIKLANTLPGYGYAIYTREK